MKKKAGKSLNRLFREAMAKLDKGEIVYGELCIVKEYRKLLAESYYKKKLKDKGHCMADLAQDDCTILCDKIEKKEITSLDEITRSEDWKLAYKYHKDVIDLKLWTYATNKSGG